MGNTVINTPELLNLDSTTGAIVLAKGTVADRPETPTFSVDYLVVAGGGGGVYSTNPGGGAGGLRTSYGSTSGGGASAENSITVTSGNSFAVTVGTGGPNINASNYNSPTKGGNSTFGTITSLAGGISMSGNDLNGFPWKNGGSGVGGAYNGNPGGQGTAGQGFAGGSINGAPNYKVGGSGGAGGVGLDATGSDYSGGSGAGGPGLAVNILNATNAATASVGQVSGSDVYYAGGGGGGSDTYRSRPAGAGGIGGGGAGGYNGNGTSATANTGGGGGGGANRPSAMNGGDGGSGVIILRYPNSVSATVNGATQASGSPFTEGNDKITVLTSGTGTITFTDSTPTNPDEYPINGTLRFNTETNKTEYFDGTGWYEIVDEYASGFIGPGTNYFDTKLYTGNGATQSIGGYINGSGSFNGSSSKIEINSNLNIANNSFSFSFWIACTDSTNDNYVIITEGNYGSNKNLHIGRIVSYPAGKMRFGFYANDLDSTTNVSTDGTWQHWVCTFDASSTTQKIYLNGVLDNTRVASSNFTGTSNLQIGGLTDWASNNEFNGSIDQVRVYDTALSSTDITALYGETAATATTAAFPSGQTAIATYTMDTSANGLLNTQDLSTVDYPSGAGCIALYEMNGNSNDTNNTYNGTPTNITYEGGAFDQAAVFNGSSSKITLDNTAFKLTTYTISHWIYSNDYSQSGVGTYDGGLDQTGGNWKGFSIIVNNNKISSYGGNNGSFYTGPNSTTTLVNGTWYHVAFVIDGTSIKGYINGVHDTALNYTLNAAMQYSSTSTNVFHLGVRSGNFGSFGYFNGSIDQVRIFNTALSDANIATLARGIATSYSGTNTDVNFNGHLNFQPDLTWIKQRSGSASHSLQDSVRGAGQSKNIYSDNTAAEGTYGQYGYLSSFDTNGFTVEVGSGSHTNANGSTYAAWNWKGGGTAVPNTDGTITTQVSANVDAGFSIVQYTAAGNQSFGHGLSQAPELIIQKLYSTTSGWYVYSAPTGLQKYLQLNSTAALGGPDSTWITAVTNATFTANWSGNSHSYINYCFHSVAGYSKIGSYTGNGSATGPIITLGFEPAFVMVKNTTGTGLWLMSDNKRQTAATKTTYLQAQSSAAEYSPYTWIEYLSNGFQLKNTGSSLNANGSTYIYMAIA